MATLISIVLVAIGVAIAFYGRQMSAKATASTTWPTTDGEIVHAAVLMQTDSSTTSGSSTTFKADVVYRYRVNDKDYTGSTVSIVDFASTGTRAENIVERYPHGAKVAVYYDPRNPGDAVLEPGPTSGITILYVVGAGFCVIGGIFLIASLTGHVTTRH